MYLIDRGIFVYHRMYACECATSHRSIQEMNLVVNVSLTFNLMWINIPLHDCNSQLEKHRKHPLVRPNSSGINYHVRLQTTTVQAINGRRKIEVQERELEYIAFFLFRLTWAWTKIRLECCFHSRYHRSCSFISSSDEAIVANEGLLEGSASHVRQMRSTRPLQCATFSRSFGLSFPSATSNAICKTQETKINKEHD
jgi:hypothetical protein